MATISVVVVVIFAVVGTTLRHHMFIRRRVRADQRSSAQPQKFAPSHIGRGLKE